MSDEPHIEQPRHSDLDEGDLFRWYKLGKVDGAQHKLDQEDRQEERRIWMILGSLGLGVAFGAACVRMRRKFANTDC